MKASVVIPVYNASDFLRECLDSVVGQSLEDLEVICVDDGSTDDSLAILHEYEKLDSRITVLTQENKGGGAARNKALEIAQGEYLAFLDADDFFEPTMLACMVEAADSQLADIVVCRSWSFDNKTKERKLLENSIQYIEPGKVFSAEDVWEYAFRFSVGWPWDKVFRRSFVEQHGLKFQELRSTNDAYFVFIGLVLAQKMFLVDDALVTHRMNNASSIENTREKSWDNAFKAMDAIGERLREEGLLEKAQQSYLNWISDFSIWNFKTLTGEAKKSFADRLQKKIAPLMKSYGIDYYYRPSEYEYMRIAAMDESDLLVTALSEHQKAYSLHEEVAWRKDESARLKEQNSALATECAELNAALGSMSSELEAQKAVIESLMAEKQELEESTSYKVGRAVTYLPRMVKNATR